MAIIHKFWGSQLSDKLDDFQKLSAKPNSRPQLALIICYVFWQM